MNKFHDVEQIEKSIELDNTTRVFTGDGRAVLFLDGIKELSQVRVGSQEIPMEEPRRYVDDGGSLAREEIEPLLTLKKVNGRPALLRSKLSNHGIWQKGVQIFVAGVWDDEKRKVSTKTDVKADDTTGEEPRKPKARSGGKGGKAAGE